MTLFLPFPSQPLRNPRQCVRFVPFAGLPFLLALLGLRHPVNYAINGAQFGANPVGCGLSPCPHNQASKPGICSPRQLLAWAFGADQFQSLCGIHAAQPQT